MKIDKKKIGKYISKLLSLEINIFGRKFYYITILLISLSVGLCISNVFSFVFALINSSFYSALFYAFMFTFNSTVAYFNFLFDKFRHLTKQSGY